MKIGENWIQKIGKVNSVILGLLIVLWGCVFLVHGQVGVVAFVLLKLYLPFIGIALMGITFIWTIWRVVKKRKIAQPLVGFLMSSIMGATMLTNLGIIDLAYPAQTENLTSVIVEWPFQETTVVGWGGNTVAENYHAAYPNIRYAYDLVMQPYDINSESNADYGIWNKAIYSPVKGTVIGTCNEEKDIIPNLEEFSSQLGNYVFIEIEDTGTYLVLAHMKEGSVQVKVGQEVEVGTLLGNVGNSGTSSEPHLHIHHQRQNPVEILTFAEGLPLYFKGIDAGALPVKGTVVTPNH